MNKKFNLFIFLTILIIIPSLDVQALTGIVNVNDSLTLRDRPTTSGAYITSFYNNTELNILDTNASAGNGCPNNWYKVSYGNYTGYSCGTYITIRQESIPTYDSEDDSYNRNNYNTAPNGDGSIMCYEDAGDLNLRKTAGGSATGSKVSCGETVKINDISESNSTCPYYYNITSGSKTGWVCGYFVNTTKLSKTAQNYYNTKENLNNYYNSLRSKGFPESYLTYLAEIHARHTNWNFVSERINLNFDDVVIGENGNGANLLEKNAFSKSYLSLNSNTYNIWTDEYKEYSGEPGYANASREAIAYYIDPRNYLNEKYIFSFETLGYSNNQSVDVVNSIIKPQAFWNRLYSNGSTGASNDIVNSSKNIGISAVHVASRIKQEMGNSDYSGDSRVGGTFTYDGVSRNGYYNFFNIKSWTRRGSSIYAAYAYENGWNTPTKGIQGGASFMYNGYISLNQDTIYYEKFDVSTTNGNYTHQYMQNLAAPVQEGGIKYNGYKNQNASYLNTAITFVIPVYNNMPTYAVTAPKIGSVNNYLKELKVDNASVNGFNYKTYNYNVYLKSGVTSTNITAATIVSTAKASGTGKINITSDNQAQKIVVTSQNGKSRTYTINFIREKAATTNNTQNNNNSSQSTNNSNNQTNVDTSNKTVADVMNHSGFKYNGNYLFGITVGTNVSKLIGNISAYNRYTGIDIKSANGQNKTNDIFKTGDKITITGSDGSKTYTAIIYGDVSGDGKVTSLDYVKIRNYITKTSNLTGVYFSAADVNKDGKITSMDYVKVRNHITGVSVIAQ